jgi:hypothetical protein
MSGACQCNSLTEQIIGLHTKANAVRTQAERLDEVHGGRGAMPDGAQEGSGGLLGRVWERVSREA